MAIVEREASWYDENSDLAARPLLASPWLGLYVLLTHWILSVAEKDYARGVVDVGSGPGQLGELLRHHAYPHPYQGFDFSYEAISRSSQLGDVIHADVRLPEDRAAIYSRPGIIVFSEVLEHLDDDLIVVEEVPEDRFVIITGPSFDSDAHVRHYGSLAELRDRYARFLQLHLVGVVDLSPPQGRRIYAISGWRV